jgi:hypothetical protein
VQKDILILEHPEEAELLHDELPLFLMRACGGPTV